jgi:myo-inositol-1(or 4)-monophosphatase
VSVASDQLLGVAAQLARAAGDLLRERFEHGVADAQVRSKSTPTDLVSDADVAAEAVIRAGLEQLRPDDGLLGEEGGELRRGSSGLRWIVDPLDGTVNFLFGIPQWSVSIAVQEGERTLAGVVLDPLRDELFAATHDGPPTLGGAPLQRPVRDGSLAQAMVATGFAYEAPVRAAQARVVARLLPRVRDLRRLGSAALDLCWTAAGRYDAYFEHSIEPWDIAAGALVCERAGLEVRPLPAGAGLPVGVLAAPSELAGELYELISGDVVDPAQGS